MVKPFSVVLAREFENDMARLEAEGRDLSELKKLMQLLTNKKSLHRKYKDHELTGDWRGHRDAHIDDRIDWILVYQYMERDRIRFVRTGSHAEIFIKQ
jgi:mRNA interferase YafQ